MADTKIFETVGRLFDSATVSLVSDRVDVMITTFKPFALAGLTVYILLYGYMVMFGKIQAPGADSFIKGAKLTAIAILGFSASMYTTYVMGGLEGIQEGLVSAVSLDKVTNVFQALDLALGRGLTIFQECMVRAADTSWRQMGTIIYWYVIGGMVVIATGCVVILGGIVITCASLMLKILYAIGPFFLLLLLFPITKRFFEAWFGQTVTYILKTVLVAMVALVAVAIFDRIISGVKIGDDGNEMQMAIELLIAGVVLFFATREVVSMAAGLGGGLSMSVMGMGQFVANAFSPISTARGAGAAARHAVNPVSTKRDLASGHMASNTRFGHMRAGNSVWNPRYRQAMRDHREKSWGAANGGKMKGD